MLNGVLENRLLYEILELSFREMLVRLEVLL